MTQDQSAPQFDSETDLKSFSCLTCRQRKVKCDRHHPCSNCVKAEAECSFIAPVRGKRKRTKVPPEGIHAKLRRYEDLLTSHGVNVKPPEDAEGSDFGMISPNATEGTHESNTSHNDPMEQDDHRSQLVIRDESSRYLDGTLWPGSETNFVRPQAEDIAEIVDEPDTHVDGLLFASPQQNFTKEKLTALHLSPRLLPKLKEIYIDRVDPLTKILHLPTFWPLLTTALNDPRSLSKSLEAAVFGFYISVIGTLSEDECQHLLKGSCSTISNRYRVAAQQALTNAGFLSTSNIMTLRAYAMFMMGLRGHYRCDTMFSLSGIAIRLARKMGLHRDGSSFGLSPFDAEMRRRLWWHLVHIDFRTADLLGTRPSSDLFLSDTKIPLNVEDEDLHPDMIDPPPEQKGITSIVLCRLRCEMIMALHKSTSPTPVGLSWEPLTSISISRAQKDDIVSEIEEILETKYLRYCDPSNTLHQFTSIIARSAVCKMKLWAYNPREFAKGEVTQRERDVVFINAKKMMEYATLMKKNKELEKYTWQVGTSFLWHTILYALIEAHNRRIGPEVDHLWQLMGVVFSYFPQLFEGTSGTVYTALRKWMLEVWDDYVAATIAAGMPEPPAPEYITNIRLSRKPLSNLSKPVPSGSDMVIPNPTIHDQFEIGQIGSGTDLDFQFPQSYDLPSLMSFQMDPNEWVQWEQWVAAEGGLAPIDSVG